MNRRRSRRGVVVLMLCVIMLGMSVTTLGVMANRFAATRKLEVERRANRQFDAVRQVIKQAGLSVEGTLRFPVDPKRDHWIVVQPMGGAKMKATEMRGDRVLRQVDWNEMGESS